MTAQRQFTWAVPVFVVLALALLVSAQASATDRIFENGFDPCCKIGGTVSGLTGSGLVLHLHTSAIDVDKPIAINGLYQFAASVPASTAFTLSVKTQPTGQTCTPTITSGTTGTSPIDNADIICNTGTKLIWDAGLWGQDWN